MSSQAMSSCEHKLFADEASTTFVVDLVVLVPESQSGLRSVKERISRTQLTVN